MIKYLSNIEQQQITKNILFGKTVQQSIVVQFKMNNNTDYYRISSFKENVIIYKKI